MDVQEILSQLERNESPLPRLALEEAVAHRGEITPLLLGVLEEVARDPARFAADDDRLIHVFAMYLLAQFRESRAYPLLVQIFSAPGEVPYDLAGDVVTEDLASILASVSDGDPSGMMALIENEHADEFVRSAGLDGLLTLVACGKQSRDEVMAYMGRLFHTLERTPSYVWDGLAIACSDLCPSEVERDLREAWEDGLIDPFSISSEEISQAIAMGRDAAMKELPLRHRLITNVVEDLEWWECFRDDGVELEDDEEDPSKYEGSFLPLLPDADFPMPFRRTQPKVGRNEPCPCGSGKKFKKCCGRQPS